MTKTHITPPKVFAHLQPSLFADSIYYADLFRFNKTIWMITECGKSKAAQLIIGSDKENDLRRDAVAIKAEKSFFKSLGENKQGFDEHLRGILQQQTADAA